MYWVADNTRYPFSTSGLENSFLGLKVSRQYSSNDCRWVVGCVAINIPPALNDVRFVQPLKIVARKAEQSAIHFLVVIAGRTTHPFHPSRGLFLEVRSGSVEDLPVVRRLVLSHVPAIFEVRVFGHLVDVEHTARRHLLLGKLTLGIAARIVFEPFAKQRVGLHLLVVGQ